MTYPTRTKVCEVCSAEREDELELFGEDPDEQLEAYLEFEDIPEYELIGKDSRIRTKKTTAAPFRYICNLEYDFPKFGRRAMCTGTLIGPRTVLTAGHCIRGRDPKRMRVIPGRDGTLEPLPATQAAKFIIPNNYAPVSPTDYGIIHLRDPIGKSIGYWSRTHSRSPGDSVGTSISAGSLPLRAGVLKINLSGYPADKPSSKGSGCRDLKRPRSRCYHSPLSDPRRQPVCGTLQYRAFNRTVRLQGGMLHYLNDTCPGHSGSPVWVKRHSSMGGRVLVAIHVGGDDPKIGGVTNRAVRINDNILRFIIANTI
jgi:glutamyl endopeptidase